MTDDDSAMDIKSQRRRRAARMSNQNTPPDEAKLREEAQRGLERETGGQQGGGEKPSEDGQAPQGAEGGEGAQQPPDPNEMMKAQLGLQEKAMADEAAYRKSQLDLQKKQLDKGSKAEGNAPTLFFVFIAGSAYALDWSMGFSLIAPLFRALMYFLVCLFTYLLVGRYFDGSQKKGVMEELFFLWAFAFLLPYGLGLLQKTFQLNGHMPSLILTFAMPAGWIFFLEKGPFDDKWKRRIGALYVVVIVALAIPFIFNSAQASGLPQVFDAYRPDYSFDDGWEAWKASVANMKISFDQMVTGILVQGSGGYYNEIVTEVEEAPLGVSLGGLQPSSSEFAPNQDVEMSGTLSAINIPSNPDDYLPDDEEAIKINLYCSAQNKEPRDVVEGEITTDYYEEDGELAEINDIDVLVQKEDQKLVNCKFEGGKLDQGVRKITFNARFNFKTWGFLKLWFLNDEVKKATDDSNLRNIGITEKKPRSHSSNGSISIGMSTKTPLVGMKTDEDTLIDWTLRLTNKWKGQANEIEKVIVFLPDGLTFNDNCDKFEETTVEADEVALLDEDLEVEYSPYKLTDQELRNLKDLKTYKDITCLLRVSGGDPDNILKGKTSQGLFIRTNVYYDYTLEATGHASIKRPDGFYVDLTPDKPISSDRLKCSASHSQFRISQIEMGYKIDDGELNIENPILDDKKDFWYLNIPEQPRGTRVTCEAKGTLDFGLVREAAASLVEDGATEYSMQEGSDTVLVGNSPPELEIEVGEAVEEQEVIIKFKVEDKDPEDSVKVRYWYEGDYSTNQEFIECENECEIIFPADRAFAKDQVTIVAIPNDNSNFRNMDGKTVQKRFTFRPKPLAPEGEAALT
ncbi:hypothetical protein ACFLZX_00295 [Nanoarchaeota archaeon]